MESMSIHNAYLTQVADIMRDLFDEHTGPITEATTARDIAQWDSLSHVRFMALVEQEFGIRFTTAEVQTFTNLGSLIDALIKRKS